VWCAKRFSLLKRRRFCLPEVVTAAGRRAKNPPKNSAYVGGFAWRERWRKRIPRKARLPRDSKRSKSSRARSRWKMRANFSPKKAWVDALARKWKENFMSALVRATKSTVREKPDAYYRRQAIEKLGQRPAHSVQENHGMPALLQTSYLCTERPSVPYGRKGLFST